MSKSSRQGEPGPVKSWSSPELALSVRLPDLLGVDVEGSQPAATEAVGIDAHQVAHVKNLARLLRTVAGDDCLAGNMRTRDAVAKRFPAQQLEGLIIHRQRRVVVGMDKDVRLGFVVGATAFEERDVLGGDSRQIIRGN
jgi:hypothetical protein